MRQINDVAEQEHAAFRIPFVLVGVLETYKPHTSQLKLEASLLSLATCGFRFTKWPCITSPVTLWQVGYERQVFQQPRTMRRMIKG